MYFFLYVQYSGSQSVCLNPTGFLESTKPLSYLEMGINPASLTQTGFIGLTGIMVAAAFSKIYYSC